MKKIFALLTCGLLAACASHDNQWEEVEVVDFDEPEYNDNVTIVEPTSETVVQPQPTYVQQPVYVQQPMYTQQPCCQVMPCQMPCYQPCYSCQQPAPQPKVTTTKKIITTTTTYEEPCGKEVCEPVVTTSEEIIPSSNTELSTSVERQGYVPYKPSQPAVDVSADDNFVEVTVDKNPYRSDIVGMRSSKSKVSGNIASKYSPEAYTVVATRATNRMLQDTSAIYDSGKTKKLFIRETKVLSPDMPFGSQRLKATAKDIISGSKTFDLVNNANNADYVLASEIDWFTANNTIPALQYRMSLLNKSGKKVKDWVEIIRPVQE